MIRVDAYVSLRLAMKMCDSRQEHLLPRANKNNLDPVLQSQDTRDCWNESDKNVPDEGQQAIG